MPYRGTGVNIKDVIIIGAGPSGIAAAIQLKRYGINPVVLEKETIGGILKNANLVENYPGFPCGIRGTELVKLFKNQLENSGVKVYFEEALELDYRNELFIVNTPQRTLSCRIAVIASGTIPRKLSIPDISRDTCTRIFYDISPLTQVANKKIAIVGAGDLAFDYALNLSKRNNVIILNRGEKIKCLPLLRERTANSEKIFYQENTRIKKIKNQGDELILTCDHPTGEREIFVHCLVVAIGRDPCLDFLSSDLERNLNQLQKLKKLYMIGDVKNDIYRQTAISVGDGIKAAMEISRKLRG